MPLEAEPLGKRGGKRLHAVALRRVMAGGDEMDTELTRRGIARLLRLTRQQRVEALVRSANQVVSRGAGRDREATDLGRPKRENQRLSDHGIADASRKLLDRERTDRSRET